jgi:dolichol kinase
MVYNIFTTPVTFFFIANGCAQLYYGFKLKRKFPDFHNFLNTIVICILWIFAGVLYPLFFKREFFNIRYFEWLSMTIICIYAPLLIICILFFEYIFVIRNNQEEKQKRNFKQFFNAFNDSNKNFSEGRGHSFNTDVHRKVFHLLPAVLIIFLWVFAVYIWEGLWSANLFWGISGEEYGIFLILTVGYTAIFIFAALDYVRLSHIFPKKNLFHLMPQNVSNLLLKTLKKKENCEFTKPVALILSLVPIFFWVPFSIFTAAALIASLGDGAASLLGLKYGKYQFPTKSSKTIIGYVSGFLVSFGASVLAFWLFEPSIGEGDIIILALGGALGFLLVDLLNLSLDDNILNPIISTLIMTGIYLVI